MKIHEAGVIIFMENYMEALKFYTEKLGFPVREQKADLTILDFGRSYLMIEDNGLKRSSYKDCHSRSICTKIRVDFQLGEGV
jgi:catechol 2,3-dioxygenase-like lactoylglutathione lyase family enzyme